MLYCATKMSNILIACRNKLMGYAYELDAVQTKKCIGTYGFERIKPSHIEIQSKLNKTFNLNIRRII